VSASGVGCARSRGPVGVGNPDSRSGQFEHTPVIGTIQGDVHDIGKNLVGMLWKGANIQVIDLGAKVPAERFWTATGSSPDAWPGVDLGGFVSNLIPVAVGNIVGGALLVAAMYWLAYRRPRPVAQGGTERV